MKTAWYVVLAPKPMLPMIAASRPVTSSETTVKMPSLMPAAIVVALRELIAHPRPARGPAVRT